MHKSSLMIILPVAGLLAILTLLVFPQGNSPQAQIQYQTPTADDQGNIYYTVKSGDTCTSVSLLNQIDMNELIMLNNLNQSCDLTAGRKLLLGTVSPQSNVATPTATPPLPSPTPFNGEAKVCIVLFDDVNGNATIDAGESALSGGVISITGRTGSPLTGNTSASLDEPTCFENVTQGDYNISVAAPEGYNATTELNKALSVTAGDTTTVDFGAQLGSRAVPTPVSEGGRSPILAVLGGLVILAGVGIGVYARLINRR
jgi:hypothetical protein